MILFGFVQEKIKFDSFINQNLCIYALCVCIAELVWFGVHREIEEMDKRENQRQRERERERERREGSNDYML